MKIKFFLLFLVLSVQLMLSFKPITAQHSSELKIDDAVQIRCFENERQALLKFKEDIIDGYDRLSSWGTEENKRDCCKWMGVHCHNRTNHVTRLDLGGPFEKAPLGNIKDIYLPVAPLQGGIITHSLRELQHLNYIDLSFNSFYSPIPEFMGSFKNLRYLNLSHASLYGSIPPHIGNLSKLQYFDVENTYLYSRNFEWLSHLHDLEYLNLNSVNLTMATNWLQVISSLDFIKELHLKGTFLPEIHPSSLPFVNASTTLVVLDLSKNIHVSSLTFRWFLNFSRSLTFVDVSSNSINGHIPDAFHCMMSVAHLDLSFNGLERIPKSFGNMSNLEYLDVSFNTLSGELSEVMMNLSGPIENKLQYLDLGWNMMGGSFPDVVKFSSLKELRLQGSRLKGSIPVRKLQLPNLLVLDLSDNNLTGPLPDFSFCSSLQVLKLDSNKFNGIPTESIRGLSNLEVLSLSSNLLQGIITEAHLFNLSRLQTLDFSSNSLLTVSHHWVPPFQLKYMSLSHCKVGPQFPKWILSQKELVYLDISDASISDSIPSELGYLASKLIHFNASNNQMFGSFPNILFSTFNLTNSSSVLSMYLSILDFPTMDLSRNNISGSINFLCHFPILKLVDLSDNQFSNQLPDCFSNFQYLQYLNLANNNFSGNMPHSFGSLSDLYWLHLRNNSFSGGIPTSMKNCTNLKMIDLGENRLTGKIPAWIGYGFSNLAFLRLSSNAFFGTIPSSICGLQTLQILDISSNNIYGDIPKCLSNLAAMTAKKVDIVQYAFSGYFGIWGPWVVIRNFRDSAYFMWKGNQVEYMNDLNLMKFIDLSNNSLSGEIPAGITKLDGLIGLNFARNNLTGSIPQNIGELRSLNFLDLSRNHLSGSVPTSLSDLSHLGFLNLSYNNLSGRVPANSHMLTIDASAYIGNPGLCGRPVLNKSCTGDNETPQVPDFNGGGSPISSNLEDDDNEFITRGFFIFLGFGFIFGFWGIIGTLFLNRSFTYAHFKMVKNVEDFLYKKFIVNKAHWQ